MKKLALLCVLALPFCANAAPADYQTIRSELEKVPVTEILAIGGGGNDFFVRIPKTDAITTIASQDKTAWFLSGPAYMATESLVQDGYCVVDIIPEYNQYRLFCGGVDDLSADTPYAVEVYAE